MNLEKLENLTNLCVSHLLMKKLNNYNTTAEALDVNRSELKVMLNELPLAVGAAIVNKYKNGDGQVRNFEQNKYREELGIPQNPHHFGGIHNKVVPKSYMNNESIDEIRKFLKEKVVQILVTSLEEKVNVKLFIGNKLCLEKTYGIKTDGGCYFLNIVDGMPIENLYETLNAKKEAKDKERSYSNATLSAKETQSRAGTAFAPFSKKIQNELAMFDSKENAFFKNHFLITTIDGHINIGKLIEIKRS